MGSREWDASDEWLMKELTDAVSAVRAPQTWFDSAKAAYAWRTVDEELELLTLTFDSSTAQGVLVRRPSHMAPRTVLFEGTDFSVELEVADGTITGQIIPPQCGHVSLISPEGPLAETDTDDAGCFQLLAPSGGPVRLRCDEPEGSLITEWTIL